MKLITKSALAVVTLSTASVAFAADPLTNTQWQTIDDESGKAAAVIQITESNGVFTGKMIKALTPDGKQHVGKTIISGLKADGNGKYSGGKILDPVKNKKYTLKVKLNGKKLRVRGYLGPIYRTQNWTKK